MQRDQLAHEENVEALPRLPARPKEPILRADEAHLDPIAADLAELGQEARVLSRVGDDEVGAPQRDPVDVVQHRRRRRSAREAAAIVDERLGERDERIEDERPPARDPPRRGHVEVARVADDHHVEPLAPSAQEQPGLRQPDPDRRAERRATTCAAAAPRRSRAARSPPRPPRAGTRSPGRCAGSPAHTSRSREPA